MSKRLLYIAFALLLRGEAAVAGMRDVLPYGQPLADVSGYFLHRPFVDDPLGEGPRNYDSDPLYRSDAFDCTTFVETVWAISLASEHDWTTKLQKIRYRDGKISFVNRLHFISRDWLPYQEKRGALSDLTAELGVKTSKVSTHIDRRGWIKRMHPRELAAFNTAFPNEKSEDVTISYLSFSDFLDNFALREALRNELRKGALLVNFVRVNWDTSRTIGSAIDISHQGFLVLKGDHIVLRHASVFHKKVVETDFQAYLEAHRQHPSLKGFQVFKILSL